MSETTSPRSGFSDVDNSGAADHLIGYLDAARQAPSVITAKAWSLDRLALRPGDSALDVGCGTGEDVVAMLERLVPDGRGVGIDTSEVMISEAIRRHGELRKISFEVADGHTLPFAPATFDAVRCERTLQHLANPPEALAEMNRVLRPNGRLTLLEPDWGTLVVEGADPEVTDRVLSQHITRHSQPLLGRKLRGLMTAEGISVEEVGATAVVYTDLQSAIRAFGLGQAAPFAIKSDAIRQEEGDQWVSDLWRANAESRFVASVTGFRAFGRKT